MRQQQQQLAKKRLTRTDVEWELKIAQSIVLQPIGKIELKAY